MKLYRERREITSNAHTFNVEKKYSVKHLYVQYVT